MIHIIQTRRLRRWLPGLLSWLCVLLFAACSQTSTPTDQASAPSSATGSPAPVVLKIGTNPEFAPFEFKTADGQLTGFDVDLINAIGETAGFLIDFDEMSFDDVIRNLYGGKIDAAASAITITGDRSDRFSFSRPYFKSGLAIAVREADTTTTGLDALKGKQIGAAQGGTTGEMKAQGVPEALVKTYPSAQQALQQLAAGQLDAVINDQPVTAYAIRSGSVKGIKIAGNPITEEFYGIATPKNSPYLEKINAALTTLLQNGVYAQIYQKWFGAQPPVLPDKAPV